MTTKARFSAEILEHVLDLPVGLHIGHIERIPGNWVNAQSKAGPATFVMKLYVDEGVEMDLPEGDVELIYDQTDGKVALREIRPVG
jgi:hypothetical protein